MPTPTDDFAPWLGVFETLRVVNGTPLVEHGAFTALDIERVIAQHNELARALVSG